MKRLFFARCLVYGSLAACLGTPAWVGRENDGARGRTPHAVPARRHVALADETSSVNWHRGVPLWQAMDALACARGGVWHRDGSLYTLRVGVA